MQPQERRDSESANSIMPEGVEQLSRFWQFDMSCDSVRGFLVLEKVSRMTCWYLIASKDVGFALNSLFMVYH